MEFDLAQFTTQIALMAVGALAHWIYRIASRFKKMEKDLNNAFLKIRLLEQELKHGKRVDSEIASRNASKIHDRNILG